MRKSQQIKGITLIALVITIIVLLILAGITINLTIGQGGIMNMAEKAGKNYIEAEEKEQEELAKLDNQLEGYINNGRETVTIDKTEYEAIKSDLEILNRKIENVGQTITNSGNATTASSDTVTLTSVTLPAGKWMLQFYFTVQEQVSTTGFFQIKYSTTNTAEKFPTTNTEILNRTYNQNSGYVLNESMAYVSGEQEMIVNLDVNNYTGMSYTMKGEIIAIRIQ